MPVIRSLSHVRDRIFVKKSVESFNPTFSSKPHTSFNKIGLFKWEEQVKFSAELLHCFREKDIAATSKGTVSNLCIDRFDIVHQRILYAGFNGRGKAWMFTIRMIDHMSDKCHNNGWAKHLQYISRDGQIMLYQP